MTKTRKIIDGSEKVLWDERQEIENPEPLPVDNFVPAIEAESFDPTKKIKLKNYKGEITEVEQELVIRIEL